MSEEIVAVKNRAILVRVDGELMCRCPYACVAVSERCEFEGTEYDPGERRDLR